MLHSLEGVSYLVMDACQLDDLLEGFTVRRELGDAKHGLTERELVPETPWLSLVKESSRRQIIVEPLQQ